MIAFKKQIVYKSAGPTILYYCLRQPPKAWNQGYPPYLIYSVDYGPTCASKQGSSRRNIYD